MEFLKLRTFVQVADLGSFSRASVKMGVTQPALSRQVRKLEAELRTELFYRDGRGVSLTPAGRKLYEVVKPLLSTLIELKDEIQDESDRLTGTVTLGLPPSICSTLGAPLALRFKARYPDAALRTQEGFSGNLLEWVDSGRLDLAVLYDARRGRSMHASPLLVENLFLIQGPDAAGESGPVAIDMLRSLKLVIPGPENGLRRVVDAAARRADIVLDVEMEMDSVSAIKDLVETGAGCTILPFGAVHREVRAGRLRARRIQSEDMLAMLVTATPLHRPVTRATHALLCLIHVCVAEFVASGILHGKVCRMSGSEVVAAGRRTPAEGA